MKNKKSSLIVKLSSISTLFILGAIVIFSVISIRSVQKTSTETAVIMGMNKLIGDMIHFESMIFNEYGQLSLRGDDLVGQNGVSLKYQYELVDKLGSETGVVATVFIREAKNYRRISTNIVDGSGKRAVDTFLDSNGAAYPVVHKGNDYIGNAVILGLDYLALYRPIFADNEKDIIGIIFIGIEISKIQQIISQSTFELIIRNIIISIAILIILVVVNTLSLNLILIKPVKVLTAIIRKLSIGDINLQIEESTVLDEIGTMKNELKRLVDGLKQTAFFAQHIGRGHLDAQYQPLSNDDVLGNSLLEMRQSLQNAEKTRAVNANNEKQRNWVTEGLAKFAEILRRDNTNMEVLSYNVISNMVKYIEANQGGIFVMNDKEDDVEHVLEMKACFAFDRKKYDEKKILPGEGLVGACYLEGEAIYMTNVPDEYINITSGLGDANPRALLICPLKVNDQIFGVIELASFKPFEPYKIEFVKKVSESIASTISTVKVNIRTALLLEKTKIQAEEMANTEEELRQSMEEMHATQDEMRRRETELLEKISKLQATS